VAAEGIPKLVGIGAEVAYLVGHMVGPRSPSNTLMLMKSLGGAVGKGAGGGGKVAGAGVGMGGGKHKSSLSPHIQKDNMAACTLMSAPVVEGTVAPK